MGRSPMTEERKSQPSLVSRREVLIGRFPMTIYPWSWWTPPEGEDILPVGQDVRGGTIGWGGGVGLPCCPLPLARSPR